jgi:hypothetical protein
VLIQFIPSILCVSDVLNVQKEGDNEETKQSVAEKRLSIQQSIVESITLMKQLQMDLTVLIKEIHAEFGPHSLVVSDQNPSLERRLTVWS